MDSLRGVCGANGKRFGGAAPACPDQMSNNRPCGAIAAVRFLVRIREPDGCWRTSAHGRRNLPAWHTAGRETCSSSGQIRFGRCRKGARKEHTPLSRGRGEPVGIKMTFARLAALACLALPAADVGAQSLDDARSAYAEGRFLAAAELAEALATSEGYALAAQSLAIHAHFFAPEREWEESVERAIRMGDEAIRADSANAEARYQAAHALGRYAQGVGAVTALRQGLAGRIRERLDAAIRLDPYHWEARLALGGWHADIAAEGFVARRMYGGNRPAAIVLFEQALQMAPESRVVLYEYAIRLPDLDEENGEERAREMLDTAARLPIVDAYDGLVQKLVREGIASREGG